MTTPLLIRSPLLRGKITHGFTTRIAGATRAYLRDPLQARGELNLGFTKEDEDTNVLHNRDTLVSAIEGGPWKLATIRQTHSNHSEVLRDPDQIFIKPDGRAILSGDGLITNLPGILLAIQTADCIPVLAYDPVHQVIAGFHAGWRGTATAIVHRGIHQMQQEYGSNPADILAAIGPGIGPAAYTVSEDLRTQFRANFPYAESLFAERNSALYLDLWEANRHQLLDAGLPAANIDLLSQCTATDPDLYFSHRRDHGISGRMMSVIGLPRTS